MSVRDYDGRYGYLNVNLCAFDGPEWFPSARVGQHKCNYDQAYAAKIARKCADDDDIAESVNRAMENAT